MRLSVSEAGSDVLVTNRALVAASSASEYVDFIFILLYFRFIRYGFTFTCSPYAAGHAAAMGFNPMGLTPYIQYPTRRVFCLQ
jgi:hypothetical protein